MLNLYKGVFLQIDIIKNILLISEYFYFDQSGEIIDSAKRVIFSPREFG